MNRSQSAEEIIPQPIFRSGSLSGSLSEYRLWYYFFCRLRAIHFDGAEFNAIAESKAVIQIKIMRLTKNNFLFG